MKAAIVSVSCCRATGAFRALIAMGVALALGTVALGQPVPLLELSGTVEAVAHGAIQVKTQANDTWMLHVAPGTRIEVTGTAEPEMLRAGRYVRLTSTVDRRGHVRDKVNQVTLIEVADRPGRRLGAFRPGQYEPPAPGDRAEDHGMPMPVIAPPMAEDVDEVVLELRGRIRSYRGNYLTLEVPSPIFKNPVRLELAAPLTIPIEVSDYSMAKPGDRISAKGPQIGQNTVRAIELNIMLSEPVGEVKKRPAPAAPAAGRPQEEERGAFGVPEPVEREEEAPDPPAPDEPEPEAPEVDAEPAQPVEPAPSPEPGQASEPNEDALLAWLTLEPSDAVPPSIRVRVGDAPPAIFTPCKPVPASDLRSRFGQPDKVFDLRGELPVGRERSRQAIRWEMWVFGETRLFVDETGMVRYRQF